MDGSAQPFMEALTLAGKREFNQDVDPIVIRNPIWVVDNENDKYIVVLPSDEFKISYTISFEHPMIQAQTKTLTLQSKTVKEEVLSARTFGFMSEVEKLHAQGLALGGSEENAIIFTENGILNPDLRYDDECIRHKILDFIGDLSLVGRPIQGHFLASRGGHGLDIDIARKIVETAENDEFQKKNNLPGFLAKEVHKAAAL